MRGNWMVALVATLMLTGCATISYLHEEYGSADPDKRVQMLDGTGFWVFLHKSKPKVIVSVDPQTASGMGFAKGLTFGAVNAAPPYVKFDEAAQVTLDELRPGCKAINPRPLETVYYEYDLVCAAPASAPQTRKKQQ